MTRGMASLVIAVLVIALVVVGVYAYQQSQKPALEVKVDGQGLQVHTN